MSHLSPRCTTPAASEIDCRHTFNRRSQRPRPVEFSNMGSATSRRYGWLIAPAISTIVWLIGAYIPALSNIWVMLNVLVPAGQPRRMTFLGAYPAVGIDGNTIASLFGLLLIIGATTRWLSYLERFTPDPAATALAAPPAVAPPPS